MDNNVVTRTKQCGTVKVEEVMAKKQGRPRTGENLIEFRVSTVLTKDEKDRLEAIAKEKRWSTATLIREALEKRYPNLIFLEEEK